MAENIESPDDGLQERWIKLTEGIPSSVQEKWWDIIKEKYSDSTRKYHTLSHLCNMFIHMDANINELQHVPSVSYAIFFHDLKYEVLSQSNEEESVKLFKEFASESSLIEDDDLLKRVEELIVLSKTHCTEEHKLEGLHGTDDLHYFLDFDVSILGSEPEEYERYTTQIREEYRYLPSPKYIFLRTRVLQLFSQIPNIYATKIYRDKYEKKARLNIENEIESLKANRLSV